MTGNLIPLFLLLLLILPSCASVKDTIVLVHDADGKVGQVTVTTSAGTQTLSTPDTAVEVTGQGKKPSAPRKVDMSLIESLFAGSIKSLPDEPITFLLYFYHDSAALTDESKTHVPEILSLVNSRTYYELSIIGHTDTTGTDEYNMRLSSVRAMAVHNLLLSQGILPGRMELRYHGKRDPLVPTENNVREPRNRRVEVIVK